MVLASALTSALKVCPRPRPRRIFLGLGLKKLSSLNISDVRYDHRGVLKASDTGVDKSNTSAPGQQVAPQVTWLNNDDHLQPTAVHRYADNRLDNDYITMHRR